MEKLPPELKSYLLEFLPFKYRLIMAEMNKAWYFASLSRTLQRKTLFVYTEPSKKQCSVPKKYSLDYHAFIDTMVKSRRQFLELKLKKLNYDHLRGATLIERLGHRIITLQLVNLFHLSGKFINAISRCCPNLNKLEIVSIRKFCGFNQDFLPIPSLKSIYFKNVRMSDRWFNLIIRCAPNLEELSFKNCRIIADPEVTSEYSRYEYHENVPKYDSKFILTDINIINNLKVAKNIKILHLDDCLHMIQQLPQHIKLNRLQGNLLKALDLICLDFDLFDSTMCKLNAHLSLKVLKLDNIPIHCLKYLSELSNLNYLHIVYWTIRYVGDDTDEEYIAYKKKHLSSFTDGLKNMKYLKTLILKENFLGNNYLDRSPLPQIPVETLMSVKSLDINIDNTFKLENLSQHLQSLRLTDCNFLQFYDYETLFRRVSNASIIGLFGCNYLDDNVLKNSNISNIKGLKVLQLLKTKLTYKSLKDIKLFHLQQLHISLSFKPIIQRQKNLEDFEICLELLNKHNPNLEFINIELPVEEIIDIQNDMKLRKIFSNTVKFKRHFKNLIGFFIHIKVQ